MRRYLVTVDATSRVALIIVVSSVRPISLNLPRRTIRERQQRGSEGPCALVRIFCAGAVVPRIQARIREHF